MDKAKLAKLMAMTTSNNDNEALAALRMANKMLTAEKVTWGEILAAGGPSVRIMIHNYVGEDWAQAVENSLKRRGPSR